MWFAEVMKKFINMSLKKKLIYLFLTSFIILLLSGCQTKQRDTIYVDKGIINLSQWDFNKDGNVRLNGQWEFYWNQLIAPGSFEKSDTKLTGFYEVPLYWTKYKDLNLTAKGFATYRTVVETGGENQLLSLKTPEIYTEYNLWVNNQLIDSNGSFAGQSVRYHRPDVFTFDMNTPRLEIVIQIKNYVHGNAGIGQSLVLGTPKLINKERNNKAAVDLILFAVCLFAGLYHVILFLFRKKEKELIYFVVICIAVAIRTIISNETYIMQVFPDMTFELGSRILTMTIPVCSIAMLLYARILHEKEMPKLVFYLLMGISGLYMSFIFITPTFFYSAQFNNYLFFVATGCIMIIYCAVKAINKGRREFIILLAGIILFMIGAFNDMLYYNQMIDTGYYLSFGLLTLVVAQAVMLAVRYSNAYISIGRLSENLKTSLDQIAATETAFLHAQIKPHFLYNVLNIIAALCRMDAEKARELILDLSSYLQHTFDFGNLAKYIPFETELDFIEAYVRIEKARFRDKLTVEYKLDDTSELMLPPLVLQPLIENAIRHGIRKKLQSGKVILQVTNQQECFLIKVMDNGIGITEKQLEKIYTIDWAAGKGIGIPNIHRRLKEIYGTGLEFKSSPGEGTEVTVIIPKRKDAI